MRQWSCTNVKEHSAMVIDLINSIINKLPIKLHIPGYQYCGPWTEWKEQLARGDSGINPLDAACKEYDFAYSKNRDSLAARHDANRVLTERSRKRVLAKNPIIGEKAAPWGVANTMNAKTKLDMGIRRTRKLPTKNLQKQKKVSLRHIVGAAKARMSSGADAVRSALKGAREAFENAGGGSNKQNRWCRSLPFAYHSLLGWQGNLARCPPPILMKLKYVKED